MTREELICADLQQQNASGSEAALALQEFFVACRLGDWRRAEDARLLFSAHNDAALDAHTRACRRMRNEEDAA